ncbi:DeoR/GlpR family DNA-binding transcription regulator [Halalkalibacterium halodurans]|jgi:DeoR family fructose operon transcriptional repressor|uniref:DeoR faimly transcriptional regulator n=2 Tax=Halalkalibacterium halodurans TaxID=86665 RepID=A0A0M0KCK6_ALKHA|nr:DeoR/GlpR family DNA-binding transcription regulator [Halalkalibacterium halodurans]TPE70284.1 DeoR/GlpR transcriptional regulator [Halalkalibacterium halodurans]
MLTIERHEQIVKLVQEKEVVTIHDLVEYTNASESTIRRDLTELEKQKKLKRIHGGASVLKKRREEPTMAEKTVKNNHEKKKIAELAASFVEDGDCLFLDAGTTTYELIPFIKNKKIVVVTNGLDSISALLEAGVETYVIGGTVKQGTRAFVGRHAIQSLQTFRFDKAFLGINGVHLEDGFTTPDPQEAYVKETALSLSREAFMLVDHSKFGETTFSTVAPIHAATIVTSSHVEQQVIQAYETQTAVKVVTL